VFMIPSHIFLMFLEISDWLSKLEKEWISCFFWNYNLLFQISFSNPKCLFFAKKKYIHTFSFIHSADEYIFLCSFFFFLRLLN
jgi:hypothetical protein